MRDGNPIGEYCAGLFRNSGTPLPLKKKIKSFLVATTTVQKTGLDLAHYLIQQDWRKFRNQTSEENEIRRIGQLKKEIRETEGVTIEIWRKVRLVRNQIRNDQIQEAEERTNTQLLREYRKVHGYP